MISVEYCQMMARYNAWQNQSLVASIDALSMKDLKADRGAFFGSIWKTANHLLWGDQLWMSRFDGGFMPKGGIAESTSQFDSKQDYLAQRLKTDKRITRWAQNLRHLDLVGPMVWHSGALGKTISRPTSLCVAHFFNHQTHHRGQLHAMLTSIGQVPDDTDLFMMPE